MDGGGITWLRFGNSLLSGSRSAVGIVPVEFHNVLSFFGPNLNWLSGILHGGCTSKLFLEQYMSASAGNRTRVTSMATMYSTTRPLMLMKDKLICFHTEVMAETELPLTSVMRS